MNPRLSLAAPLLATWIALLSGAHLSAEDAVVLQSEGSSGGQIRVPGEIVDYTGQAIRLRSATGLERSYASDRVVRIETQWTSEQLAGEKAQAAGQTAEAIDHFRRALQKEPRVWARRRILAELTWCHTALEQPELAGDTFLLLLESDPATQDFDAIPLAWLPAEAVSPRKARAWLGRADLPAARLLGASYLMAGDQRSAALAALEDLQRDADPRVAHLALAQSWRATAFRATADDITRWQAVVERMPEALRAGPYFLLGQAQLAQNHPEAAALALLRVPILYPRDRPLAAAALVAAGHALHQAGQPDAARTLYQEVLDHPAPARWQAEAQQRLEGLGSRKSEGGSR